MTGEYESEHRTLIEKSARLKAVTGKANDNAEYAKRFLKLVRRYTKVESLDAEIVRMFVIKNRKELRQLVTAL